MKTEQFQSKRPTATTTTTAKAQTANQYGNKDPNNSRQSTGSAQYRLPRYRAWSAQNRTNRMLRLFIVKLLPQKKENMDHPRKPSPLPPPLPYPLLSAAKKIRYTVSINPKMERMPHAEFLNEFKKKKQMKNND